VWIAEDELIDDYLDDRLTADERARFERHYLATPDHQARLAIARD
jgi:anti-sigma factor RsiW